ncbi:MAG: hypothetical protein IPP17_04190 [Bacteroidetes bacterium]|nr:hypothetical protein [Bacteroidota bacterium]
MKSFYTFFLVFAMLCIVQLGMSQGGRPSQPSGGISKGGSQPSNASSSPKATHSTQPRNDPKPTYSQPTHSQPRNDPKPTYSQPTYSQPRNDPKPSYSQPTYSQPRNDPKPSYSQPTYSQPRNDPKPTYSQPSYSQPRNDPKPTYSQPTYSQPRNDPKPTYSQPTYSQPRNDPKPTYSHPSTLSNTDRPTNDSRPVTSGSGPRTTFGGPSSQPSTTTYPKPNVSPASASDGRPTYITGYEMSGQPTVSGNTGPKPKTETVDPRVQTFSSGTVSAVNDSRPNTPKPNTFSGAAGTNGTSGGGDDEPVEDPGNISNVSQYVNMCVDGHTIVVAANMVQNYTSIGGVVGPCNTSGGGPSGPIGHGNPVGPGNGDPIDPAGPTGGSGPIGHGGGVGPTGDPIDHGGGHGGNGGGHGGNGGGHGHNGGPAPQGSWTGTGCTNPGPSGGYGGYYGGGYVGGGYGCTNTWYAGSGCGHSSYGGFCGGCSSTNYFYSSNYYDNCTSYYGYGYYYPASYNVGWCYTGRYSGVSFTLIYPFVSRSYQLESFTPSSDNRRVVILDSKNGKKHWRIVEERVWMPERILWDNGTERRQEGYYTWRVVEKTKIRHKRRHCRVCDPR